MKPIVTFLVFVLAASQITAQWEKILEVKKDTYTVKILSVYADDSVGIFAGAAYMGLFHSPDSGISWDYKGFESFNSHVRKIVKDNSNRILILTNRIFYSLDTGDTWQKFNIINYTSGNYESVRRFSYDPSSGYIYAGAESEKLYISTNQGENWTAVAAFDIGCWCGSHIDAIEVFPEKKLLVGAFSMCGDMGGTCYRYDLFKSLNGFSWYHVLHADINTIHSIDGKLILAASESTLYRSTDAGDSWSGAPFSFDINVIKSSKAGVIYLGTENGVYLSTNSGVGWDHIDNDGLTNTLVNDISLSDDGIVYAATNDGLYKYPGIITGYDQSSDKKPNQFYLEQNYPNPFNPETTIKYYVPYESKINIDIFNLLGEKVADLINEVKSEGYYEINWKPGSLPSGIYIYRITAFASSLNNNFSEEKKMILIK